MRYVFTGLALTLMACEFPKQQITEPQPGSVMDTQDTHMNEVFKPMVWDDLTGRVLPKNAREIRVGAGETDIVDLWLPSGIGPHPVVIMIHGGCWQKGIADRTLMNYAAEELRSNGLAVWNIEYRGVDEAGGGYPGTFLDVAKAADALPLFAKTYNLKTDKVAALGHSAGGHLAAWLSVRSNLPETSPLYSEKPLTIDAVINSGGLADLEASASVTFDGCLADIMDTLVGAPTEARPNVFSDTSPTELFPASARHISINGDHDNIAPPSLGKDYTEKAIAAGMTAEFILAARTGHVELVTPGTEAFDTQSRLLVDILEPSAP